MMDSSVGLLGVKLGMSRIFNEQGASVPVTVIYADTNRVCQLKTKKTDGYDAVQLAAGTGKAQRTSKALGGHYKKAGVPFGHKLAEFRIRADAEVPLGYGGHGGAFCDRAESGFDGYIQRARLCRCC